MTVGLVIIALIGISLVWVFRTEQDRSPPPHRDPLLAVLPFRNVPADGTSRYFADGVTEEIIDALLQLTQIRVAAPASSFVMRNADARKTAKALAATHVLTGSVGRDGGNLRVVAQLVDSQRNRVLWGHIYRTTVGQTSALQHHIAVQIANALDMRLSPRSFSDAARIDPVAYDHFLRGRDLFWQRRDIDIATEELEKSVSLAPEFAKAWSTLAETRYLFANWYFEVGQGREPRMEAARSAAKRALALDPNNGEAFGVLAVTSEDSVAADRLFERGLHAEPNNTQLLTWHSSFLRSVGRMREAYYELERAYQLDRLSTAIIWNFALAMWEQGDVEPARQVIELGKDKFSPQELFETRGDYLLAGHNWRALTRHLAVLPAGLRPASIVMYRLASETAIALEKSDTTKFATLRTRWRALRVDERLDPFYAVQFLTLLGDSAGALSIIQAAPSTERGTLFNPSLPELRRTAGAKTLLAKWGLFDYWRQSNHWPDFCEEPGLPFDCKAEARKLKS